MSDGLYKSLEEATSSDQVNKDIAQLVVSEVKLKKYSYVYLFSQQFQIGSKNRVLIYYLW